MRRNKYIVHFTHGGKSYENFDRTHPYFVIKDGEIESCHERYEDAKVFAPYNGGLSAGKMGHSSGIVTNEGGLVKLGIDNPIPLIEP